MERSGMPRAVAYVHGDSRNPRLHGTVMFYPCRGGVLVKADIRGLPENGSGFYGFHIHEGESCGGSGFSETGGHWNPKGEPHPRHSGDLPPLLGRSGLAYLEVITDRFRIRDIIGRTAVIHSGPDDFQTQPAGNSGEKIACGRIRLL